MKHYTTAQLADLLGMHPRSIADDRRDRSLGGIPFTRIGRAVRYRDDDVRQWLDQRRYIGGADTSLRAGSVPTGAHNPGHAGSTPAPATNSAPHGKRCCSGQCRAHAAASSLGTDPATGAQRGTRDGRERPAGPRQVRGRQRTSDAPPGGMPGNTISAQAGALLNPPLSSLRTPAGAVSQTAREGRR